MFGKIFDNSKTKTTPLITSARRTVDDVMASFKRTLDDLKKVEEEHAEEAAYQNDVATKLNALIAA